MSCPSQLKLQLSIDGSQGSISYGSSPCDYCHGTTVVQYRDCVGTDCVGTSIESLRILRQIPVLLSRNNPRNPDTVGTVSYKHCGNDEMLIFLIHESDN